MKVDLIFPKLSFTILFILLLLLFAPTFETVEAGGVGVEDVEPMISMVNVENENGDYNVTVRVLDLNSWRSINLTALELYKGEEISRRYVFEQDEDTNREFKAEKGPQLIDYGAEDNLTSGDGPRERCEMQLNFKFPGGNHDTMRIIVEDHAGNRADSNIQLQSLEAGREMSLMVLPVAATITGITLYNIKRKKGTKIHEE